MKKPKCHVVLCTFSTLKTNFSDFITFNFCFHFNNLGHQRQCNLPVYLSPDILEKILTDTSLTFLLLFNNSSTCILFWLKLCIYLKVFADTPLMKCICLKNLKQKKEKKRRLQSQNLSMNIFSKSVFSLLGFLFLLFTLILNPHRNIEKDTSLGLVCKFVKITKTQKKCLVSNENIVC